jgi:homoserine kinase
VPRPGRSCRPAAARRSAVAPAQRCCQTALAGAAAATLTLGLATDDWDLIAAGLRDRLHQSHRAQLFPRSAQLLERAPSLGALGATISGAGPTVLVWCHYEQTAAVVKRLQHEADGWATVVRAPFETQGADVREL